MKKIYLVMLAVMVLLVSCNDKKNNQLSFHHYVYESFATDSIVLELGDLAKNLTKEGEPVYYVGYDLEFPAGAINEEVLRRLQLNVIGILKDGVDMNSKEAGAEMERLFAGMRLAESDTCPIDPIVIPFQDYNITSHELNVVRTITNADSLYTLCLSTDYNAFGAAHGSYALKYYSFSTVTGNALTFDSLFVAGADTVFCNYMIEQIPVEYKESYNEEFTFQADPRVENGSFYFTPDGVMFSFSPYAIGSYADGQIECLIPVSIAKPLLQKVWGHLLK